MSPDIVLADIVNAEEAAGVARRVREVLLKPCVLGETEVTVTTSIGISAFPEDSEEPDTLIKQADAAMHHAKNLGRDGYQFFTEAINERASKRFKVENQLRKALVQNQFEMYYQPKVELRSRRVTGAEALVRWRHPELGMVSPAEFIPIAEETGLVVPLGDWILREVCRQISEWRKQGLSPLAVSVKPLVFRCSRRLQVVRRLHLPARARRQVRQAQPQRRARLRICRLLVPRETPALLHETGAH